MERTVLIVDDDHLVCKEMEKLLRRSFFSTLIAYTGADALGMLKESRVDVILLDVRIPDIDGLEVLRLAKEANHNCEVIIITGYGSQDIAVHALRAGAIDYLEKPINTDELTAAMGRALERLAETEELTYRNTILIVDDDEDCGLRLKRYLEKNGYDAFNATNGKQALEIIDSHKIDVVLTDIKMPEMSGIEFLERVRKIYRDIEFVMITGYGDEEQAIRCLRKGAINYLRKPIDLDELTLSIEKAIERIVLYRNQLYRNRELKINAEIISKINEELERRIEERSRELSMVQGQLFQTSKLATLGEMSAGLAHELNQPLTGISLAATNVRKLHERGLLDPEDLMEVLKDIETNVRRMSRVITHIRTFARQDTLKFVNMRIVDSIENAFSLFGEQLRLHEIEVVKEYAEDIPSIMGEPYQIEQVIINVISNARDALDEKGRWQEDEREQGWSKKLSIKTYRDEDWACMSFADNGMGMTAETKEKVFNPFYTTKEVGQATGLGMSISYGIVRNHRGRIEIESDEGKGTTITVMLPLRLELKDE